MNFRRIFAVASGWLAACLIASYVVVEHGNAVRAKADAKIECPK